MPVGEVPPSVVQLLHDLGANDDEIERAAAINRLPALAVDYVLARDFSLTVDQVAEHFATPPEYILEIYRLLGVTIDRNGRVLGPSDIALLDALSVAGTRRLGTGGDANLSQDAGENLLRVIGGSIGRIADARGEHVHPGRRVADAGRVRRHRHMGARRNADRRGGPPGCARARHPVHSPSDRRHSPPDA